MTTTLGQDYQGRKRKYYGITPDGKKSNFNFLVRKTLMKSLAVY
ncbi:protein of unknown function [Streptococcus thermophilus]|nr:protein of unknown function [Streptococcus thermophilus]CAD0148878.1 protein of unknown function [Streptococcus thermophilus]CAD0152021.1 protein of unknown function [Streptococcus thermophilus]